MAEQEAADLPLSQETFQELWNLISPRFGAPLGSSSKDEEDRGWENLETVQSEPPETLLQEDSEEAVIERPPTCSPQPLLPAADTTRSPDPSVISTTSSAGEFGFQLRFHQSGTAKSVTSTYSPDLNKLYCLSGKTCPLEIHMDQSPPPGALLRATAVYKLLEHRAVVVRCCPYHEGAAESNEGLATRSHLIRAEGCQRAQYVEDSATGRHSVLVPFEQSQPGTKYCTVFYTFMCNISCKGGMNRRPILTIITLETQGGEVLGKGCFEVRVCACPGRDRKNDEKNFRKRSVSFSEVSPLEVQSKKRKYNSTSSDDEVYILRVRGKERFEMMKKINDSLELSDNIPAAVLERYTLKVNSGVEKRERQPPEPKKGKKPLKKRSSDH